MKENDEAFWWSEWGRKNALESFIVVNYFFIFLGMLFLLASHISVDFTEKVILSMVGVILITSSFIATRVDLKQTEKWLEDNE